MEFEEKLRRFLELELSENEDLTFEHVSIALYAMSEEMADKM